MLSMFPNYNPEATVDDLSCDMQGQALFGCTDNSALNYESQANTDNGSCTYHQVNTNNIKEKYIPLHLPEGWSMFGYTCVNAIDAVVALQDIVDELIILKDAYGSVYLPEWGFNGLGNLEFSRGYQIKLKEEITNFSFCPTYVVEE